MVELIEKLLGKGYELALYDSSIRLAALSGANKDFILTKHLSITLLFSASSI